MSRHEQKRRWSRSLAAMAALMVVAAGPAAVNGADLVLAWDLPTHYADGTPLESLAGCRVHYGTIPGQYSETVDVTNAASQCTISGLNGQLTHYFVVTAYDSERRESSYSEELVWSGDGQTNAAALCAHDFDGDGRSDFGFYAPDLGGWSIELSSSSNGVPYEATFGYIGTVPVVGDFDGDGIMDFGCYDAAGLYADGAWVAPPGSWYIMQSRDGFRTETFGYEGTVPVVGDFDGDGVTDFGCYDAAGLKVKGQWLAEPGSWYVMQSSAGFRTETFGYAGTVPIVGDFDGDGVTDFGCYDPAGLKVKGQWMAEPGSWYVMQSRAGFRTETFGYIGTVPIVGDFDGDGVTDFGCYDAAGLKVKGQWLAEPGSWYIMQSRDGFRTEQLGDSNILPVVGDYDGDGIADLGCYDEAAGRWSIMQSRDGLREEYHGGPGALPLGGMLEQ